MCDKRMEGVVILLLVWCGCVEICGAAPDSPNIVFIVADDLVGAY